MLRGTIGGFFVVEFQGLVTLQECQECGIFLPITVHRTPAIENHRPKLGLRSPLSNAIKLNKENKKAKKKKIAEKFY